MSIEELAIEDREMLMESRLTPEARASIAASAALMAWEVFSPINRFRRYVSGLYVRFATWCGFPPEHTDRFRRMYARVYKN